MRGSFKAAGLAAALALVVAAPAVTATMPGGNGRIDVCRPGRHRTAADLDRRGG